MDDSILDVWGDLRVGDPVRLSEDVLGSGAREAVAVVRGPYGEVETMNARFLRKLA